MDEKLQQIIATMVANGESHETITAVIEKYKTENTTSDVVEKTEVVAEDAAPVTAETPAVEDTELVSEDISLDGLSEDRLKNIKSAFDQGEFKMAEKEAFENYKETGELDVNLLPDESLNPEKSLLIDYGSRLGTTVINLVKGKEDIETGFKMLGAKYAMDLFNSEATKEEKAAAIQTIKLMGDAETAGLNKGLDALSKNLRVYETESMVDDFNNKNYGQFAERVVGQTIGAIPSIALSMTGIGGLIAMGTSSAGNKFSELIEENPEESLERVMFNSLGTGAIEAVFEIGTRSILKKAGLLEGTGAKKAASDLIQSYTSKFAKYLGIPGEGFLEAGTVGTQDLLDALPRDLGGLGKAEQYESMSDYFEARGTVKKMWDAFSVGTAMGGGVYLVGSIKSNKQAEKDRAEYMLTPESDKKTIENAAKQINTLSKGIKTATEDQVSMIEDQIAKEEQVIINTRKKVSEELNLMKTEELKSYAKGIDEIAKMKSNLKSKNPFIVKKSQEQIQEAEENNTKLIRESVSRRLNDNVKAVTKEAEKIGKTVNTFKTAEEYQKAYDNTDVGQKNSMNVQSSDGFFDPNGDIYINEEVAQQVKSVNVAAHELLHGILNNSFKEPGQLKKVVSEFKSVLPADQAAMIQKRIDDNYRYEKFDSKNKITTAEQDIKKIEENEDGSVTVELKEEVYNEEYLTAFADLIGNKKIKFNENIFTRVGNFLAPLFRGKGYGHIRFNTGKDVFEFIKDYQKQIEEGELKPDIIKLAEEGVKGKLMFSKSEVTDLAKQYKADPAKTDVEQLVKQYNNVALKALGYDISKGTIAPEEAISFVNKEFDSILRRYDGSTEFSTWINSNIRPKRQAFYDEQIGKQAETTSIDSEQARQVVDDSDVTTDDRTEKEIRQAERKIKVAKRLNLEDKAVKEVSEKVKDVDLSKVNYKTLKNLANETIGETFGISPKKILSNANLTKGEIANAQRYIKNNVDLLKALLPDGYNKDFKSTGVPKVLLDKFYNKRSVRAKTGAGLNVQIKKPNIGSTEFLEVFGFVDGKPIRDDRNISARIIALANQTGKAITNQTVREQLQKEGMPESALQDIKSGTPTAMFSKSKDANKLSDKDIAQIQSQSTLRSINDATKEIGIQGKATVSDATRPGIQSKILKAFGSSGLGLTTFESMMPASAGAKSNRRDNGDKYYKLTNGKEILGQRVLDEDGKQVKDKKGKKRFKPPTIEQIAKKHGEGVTLVADGGRIYYGVTDPAYIKARKAAVKNDPTNKYQRIPVGKDPIGKAWLNKKNRKKLTPREQGEVNFKAFKQSMLEIEKAVQDGNMDIETAALMIAQGYQATAGIIKGVAPFKYKSRNMEFAKTGKQQSGKVPFREEHNPPASVIGANLIWAIKNGKVEALMPYIKKNYYQTQLSLSDDLLLDLAKLDATLVEGTSILDNPIIRFAVAGINLNTILNIETGKSIIDEFGLGVDNKFSSMQNVIVFQNNLVEQVVLKELDIKEAKKQLDQYLKIAPSQLKASKSTNKTLSDSKVLNVDKNLNIQDLLGKAAAIDDALSIARNVNAPVKKIRVFDFDDTLATTESDVLFTAPDGTEGKLNAEEFAKEGKKLLDEGYVFDFSEFNKVTKGKPGPLLDIAKKIQAARGTEDVFVLTARAPEAQPAIKEFLESVGLNIPLKNITGLGNSTGEAKANWMVDKAAEGYNDFYFADDAYQNVKAVRDVMSVVDVKSKVQQAKFSLAKDLNSDFNKILENKTGIGAEKVYSDARAKTVGANKGRFKFFIPPSAEDFVGLLYPTLAKGKLGDQQMAWYKERLLNPFARAMENLSKDRVNLMADFKSLKKELEVPKDLRKEAIDGFTNEQAVRVYLWNKQGLDIPGISKRDLKDLTGVINNNPKLKVFADQLQAINKSEGYPSPQESWLVGTITTDLINGLNTVKRSKYLEEWQTNSDIIFSKENLNKMEAIYGANYREAMENILSRMKTGKNRLFSESRIGNQVLDYINGSIGAIMFFNTRSAVLQTISSINFINWSDNNIYKAGKAFANQKQYWSDFTKLMNSDFLKDRRQGLKLNISESEIADAAATSKNKAKAALNYLLQKGFLPTQLADSFAIASGGATFYRNKINTLVKEGMSQKEAEEQAYRDFREIAEESQQSSRPDKISQQQASNVGRVILAFANTPSQYARIIKKAASDLKNKRGDWKNNVSKIMYYGAMQNLIFNVLQQALFAVGFGDDDEETEKREKKYVGIANGMIDSLLRGLGYGGAAVSVTKNLLLDVYERSKRDRPEYVDAAWKLLDFSPPIDSKVSKLKAAGYMVDKYGDDMISKGFAIDNPAYEAASKVVSATTNVPLDRVFTKANNISAAMGEDAETWQRAAMMLGWPEWQVKPEPKKKKRKKKKSAFGSSSFSTSSFANSSFK